CHPFRYRAHRKEIREKFSPVGTPRLCSLPSFRYCRRVTFPIRSVEKMKSFFLFALITCLGASALSSQSLTPEQIASLKAKLESIKKSLDQNATNRHTTAGETFLQASVDP